MFAERRPGGQRIVIAADGRMMGPLDRDVEVAVEHVPELNVGEREVGASEMGLGREPRLGDVEQPREPFDRLADGSPVRGRPARS